MYYKHNKFFGLKVKTNQEFAKLKEMILAVELGDRFQLVTDQTTGESILVFGWDEKETFFDLLTILKKHFPQIQQELPITHRVVLMLL